MIFTKKHVLSLFLCLTFLFTCSAVFANPQMTIENRSNRLLYIYDTGNPQNPLQLADGHSVNVTLPSAAGRRMFFSDQKLTSEPDPTNPSAGKNINFSFLEYTVEANRYTIDMSYVDVFSYPVTLKFSAAVSGVCDKGFEYGFKSFVSVANELKRLGSPWSLLVWQDPSNKIYRILGPSRVWMAPTDQLKQYYPQNYQTFYANLPPDGTQLFNPRQNNPVWQNDVQIPFGTLEVEPKLVTVGYSKALLFLAPLDSNKKHGFYIFPKDAQAEFTNLPNSVNVTATVYPYDK